MEKLMDDRGISPLVATVILIAITVAAAGSIAVIITRLSPGSTTLPTTCDVEQIFKDNDSTVTTYNTLRPVGKADDNIIYIRVTSAAGARVYSPDTDLVLSFAFAWDNGTACSGAYGFPSRTISSSGCYISTLLSTRDADGYFSTGCSWLVKVDGGSKGTATALSGVNENTAMTITVATGGKTTGYSGTSSYWLKVLSSLG